MGEDELGKRFAADGWYVVIARSPAGAQRSRARGVASGVTRC